MKIRDYLEETRLTVKGSDKGRTTKNDGHDHEWFIDHYTGDGATGKDKGHSHLIKAMVVLPAKNYKNEHIHMLGEKYI